MACALNSKFSVGAAEAWISEKEAGRSSVVNILVDYNKGFMLFCAAE
jgi:hypothetical protein